MRASIGLTYIALIIMATEWSAVRSKPEPMARPTRPKVFTSPEELRQYLDLVLDYYTLNAKPRYGKRADTYKATNALEHPINILRMITALDRQKQPSQLAKQEQLDKEDSSKLRMIYPNERVNKFYDY